MAEIGRLNNIIRAWEEGRTAIASFAHTDRQTATAFSTAPYDGVLFEMEHNPWDMQALEDSLQFMLNRRQIVTSGSFAPAVTPMVRIPANGVEMTQSFAKQALDRGVYGVAFPHKEGHDNAHSPTGNRTGAVGSDGARGLIDLVHCRQRNRGCRYACDLGPFDRFFFRIAFAADNQSGEHDYCH